MNETSANSFSFQQWFTTSLIHELLRVADNPSSGEMLRAREDNGDNIFVLSRKLVRKRVVWLIGKFFPYISSSREKCFFVLVFQSLLKVLLFEENNNSSSGNSNRNKKDIVLLMSVVESIKVGMEVCTDTEMLVGILRESSAQILAKMFEVVRCTQSIDVRDEIFLFCEHLIEKLGPHLSREAIGEIIRNIESLFHTSSASSSFGRKEDSLSLQSSLVHLLTCLVSAVRTLSLELRGFIVPLMRYCLQDATSPLVVSALSLWLATVKSAPSFDPLLIELFPFLFRIPVHVERSNDEKGKEYDEEENKDKRCLLQLVLSVLDACVLVSEGSVVRSSSSSSSSRGWLAEISALLLRIATEAMIVIGKGGENDVDITSGEAALTKVATSLTLFSRLMIPDQFVEAFHPVLAQCILFIQVRETDFVKDRALNFDVIVSVVHLLARTTFLARATFLTFLTTMQPYNYASLLATTWVCWLKSSRTMNPKTKLTDDGGQLADVIRVVALALTIVSPSPVLDWAEAYQQGIDVRTESDDENDTVKTKRRTFMQSLQGTDEFRRYILRSSDSVRVAMQQQILQSYATRPPLSVHI